MTKKEVVKKLEFEAKLAGFRISGEGKSIRYRMYQCLECGYLKEAQVSKIRERNVRCNGCYESKLEIEAKEAGLCILGSGQTSEFRKYKFNKCGHIKEIRTASVRNNSFTCKICLEDKYKLVAKEAGLTLIRKSGNPKTRIYKFNKCGHLKELGIRHIGKHSHICDKCFELKLEKNALRLNLKLLGYGKNKNIRKYKRIDCGHEVQHRNDFIQATSKTPECLQCIDEKHHEEANRAELILINKTNNPRKKLYKFINCGHEQEISTSHVKDYNFICHTCNETYYSLPSLVYLIKISVKGFSFLKLGYTNNIKLRVLGYELIDKPEIVIIKSINFPTGKEANNKEALIHDKYKNKKLLPKLMKKYMKSGFNECYPLEMKEILVEELANLGDK